MPKSDWTITLGDFSMTWKEPMEEEDIHDIEQLTDLALSAMRRRMDQRDAAANSAPTTSHR